MVRGRTLQLGRKPVDLAEGTRQSGVQIQALRNRGKHPVWLGEVGDGYRIDPGESAPGSITLGSTDRLPIVADIPQRSGKDVVVEVHVLLGYEEVVEG